MWKNSWVDSLLSSNAHHINMINDIWRRKKNWGLNEKSIEYIRMGVFEERMKRQNRRKKIINSKWSIYGIMDTYVFNFSYNWMTVITNKEIWLRYWILLAYEMSQKILFTRKITQ